MTVLVNNPRRCLVYSYTGDFVIGELREIEFGGSVDGVFVDQPRHYSDWYTANHLIKSEVEQYHADRCSDSDDFDDA